MSTIYFTVKVFALYAETDTLHRVANLCLTLNLPFYSYSDEYFIFKDDPTEALVFADPALEGKFRVALERWAEGGALHDCLGFKVVHEAVKIDAYVHTYSTED